MTPSSGRQENRVGIQSGQSNTSVNAPVDGPPSASPWACAPMVGEGLPMISKLLRHNKVQITVRYAHLADNPVKSAANRISSRIVEIAQ